MKTKITIKEIVRKTFVLFIKATIIISFTVQVRGSESANYYFCGSLMESSKDAYRWKCFPDMPRI